MHKQSDSPIKVVQKRNRLRIEKKQIRIRGETDQS